MSSPSKDHHPDLEYLEVPGEYEKHPLVRNELFYVLPVRLLELLGSEVGSECFNAELWKMEWAMTRACGNEDGVGFWKGKRLQFPLLRFQRLNIDPAFATSHGWTEKEIETMNTLGADRDERFATTARGFAGWLLTNHVFLAEQAKILHAWRSEIQEFGIPKMGPVLRNAAEVPGATSRPSGDLMKFAKEFETFFIRWRLVGMIAPFLPSPLGPQMPVPILESLLGHMRGGGQTFYMPETFPVPTRDELRRVIEDALHGAGAPPHLNEWIGIIRAENAAKNAISRFARLFELQHYFRVLYQRHAEALPQRKAAVTEALASFLGGVSFDTIEKDLIFVADRLGKDWYLRASLPPSSDP